MGLVPYSNMIAINAWKEIYRIPLKIFSTSYPPQEEYKVEFPRFCGHPIMLSAGVLTSHILSVWGIPSSSAASHGCRIPRCIRILRHWPLSGLGMHPLHTVRSSEYWNTIRRAYPSTLPFCSCFDRSRAFPKAFHRHNCNTGSHGRSGRSTCIYFGSTGTYVPAIAGLNRNITLPGM